MTPVAGMPIYWLILAMVILFLVLLAMAPGEWLAGLSASSSLLVVLVQRLVRLRTALGPTISALRQEQASLIPPL